jgi:hypothetical protein
MANLRLSRTAAIGLLSVALFGGDFDQLVATVKKSWPDRTTFAVVCDAAASKAKIDSLAAATGAGMKIAVIDVKGPQDVGKAVSALGGQKPQLLVLIPGDRVAGDGQAGATFLVQRLAALHIPTVATTEAGAKQGAVFAVGPTTAGKILVNSKSAAVAGVTAPEGQPVS